MELCKARGGLTGSNQTRPRPGGSLAEDAGSFRKWWSNRLLRVILVFIFSQIGSMIGTYVGGYEIITSLFGS